MPKSELNKIQEQKQHRLWIEGLLVSALNRKWFGKITVEIKRGEIFLVHSEESLKPPKLKNNRTPERTKPNAAREARSK